MRKSLKLKEREVNRGGAWAGVEGESAEDAGCVLRLEVKDELSLGVQCSLVTAGPLIGCPGGGWFIHALCLI